MPVLSNVLNKDYFGLEEWGEWEKKMARNRIRNTNLRTGREAPRGDWEEKVRRVAEKSKGLLCICYVPGTELGTLPSKRIHTHTVHTYTYAYIYTCIYIYSYIYQQKSTCIHTYIHTFLLLNHFEYKLHKTMTLPS